MKKVKNLTDIKKGDILYYAPCKEYWYSTQGVLEAKVTRVTTTSEYVLAHVEYEETIGGASRKTRSVALFHNRNHHYDLCRLFYFAREEAQRENDDVKYIRRQAEIGEKLVGVSRVLLEELK
ncbi:MAG: hypothetical protein IKN59_01765 [Paludibacteraceae bacterium]|nr:hypothetical protein [Paludibacteraceae bacterium]